MVLGQTTGGITLEQVLSRLQEGFYGDAVDLIHDIVAVLDNFAAEMGDSMLAVGAKNLRGAFIDMCMGIPALPFQSTDGCTRDGCEVGECTSSYQSLLGLNSVSATYEPRLWPLHNQRRHTAGSYLCIVPNCKGMRDACLLMSLMALQTGSLITSTISQCTVSRRTQGDISVVSRTAREVSNIGHTHILRLIRVSVFGSELERNKHETEHSTVPTSAIDRV